MPNEVAMIAGTIGPDIGYYIKTALPNIKLYLVDVVEEPLKNAQKRFEGYAKKAVESKKMKEDKAKEVLANIVFHHGLQPDQELRSGDRSGHRKHSSQAEDL